MNILICPGYLFSSLFDLILNIEIKWNNENFTFTAASHV